MKLILHALLRRRHPGGPTPVSLSGRPLAIGWMKRCFMLLMLCSCPGLLQAQTNISVPNASFESPETLFVDTQVDSWEKTPQPFWWDELSMGPWIQLMGVFLNTPSGTSNHIGNIDGDQALYLFAVPEVGLFQDYDSIGGTNTVPSHEFDATFQTGKSYRLTVGVIGGGGTMTEGALLGLGLYYRDASSNRVSIAMTNVAFTPAAFPDTTNFIDVSISTGPVEAADAWAGEYIGVELLSTVGFGYTNGGYWDLDNVRLVEFIAPRFIQPIWTNGQFEVTLVSDLDAALEILIATNLSVALSNWVSLGAVTNVTGTTNWVDPSAGFGARFYCARELP